MRHLRRSIALQHGAQKKAAICKTSVQKCVPSSSTFAAAGAPAAAAARGNSADAFAPSHGYSFAKENLS